MAPQETLNLGIQFKNSLEGKIDTLKSNRINKIMELEQFYSNLESIKNKPPLELIQKIDIIVANWFFTSSYFPMALLLFPPKN